MSTSYRLDQDLEERLARRAAVEGITETALVTRLLEQGLGAIDHPGIVYRPGPSGWRAGLAGGPDIDEVVRAVRSAGVAGDGAVPVAADRLGIDARLCASPSATPPSTRRGHDGVHVRAIGLGGAPDADVLARAAETGRTLVTENAADFRRLLDGRQGAGSSMTPVLVALTTDRGAGGTLHARPADAIDRWAGDNPTPTPTRTGSADRPGRLTPAGTPGGRWGCPPCRSCPRRGEPADQVSAG